MILYHGSNMQVNKPRMYEIYHTERLQNAFDNIDSLIAERSKTNSQPI